MPLNEQDIANNQEVITWLEHFNNIYLNRNVSVQGPLTHDDILILIEEFDNITVFECQLYLISKRDILLTIQL